MPSTSTRSPRETEPKALRRYFHPERAFYEPLKGCYRYTERRKASDLLAQKAAPLPKLRASATSEGVARCPRLTLWCLGAGGPLPRFPSLNTWMRLPMVKSIAQRLGRDAEPQIEAVFKGPATFVIRTERGWKTLTELPKHSWDWKDDFEFWPTPASARANLSAAAMAGLDPLDVSPFPPAMIVVPPSSASEERRLHSNAQFALSLPLSVIVSSYTESEDRGRCRQRHAFRSRRTVAVGARWPGSHQAALCRRPVQARDQERHRHPLHAPARRNPAVDRKNIHVHQESSTQVVYVGTTAVQVADDIRRKLGP